MSFVSHCPRLSHPDPRAAACELLMWDGRLDNRAELMARVRDGLSPDASDAALTRATYQQDGVPGLGRLIGDWSAVIRDRRAGLVVLASDFAGVRPLYYSVQGGAVAWSTRLDTLVERTHADALDERYIAGFMLFGGYPTRTPYEGIRMVPPGHAVCVSARRTTSQSFWALPPADTHRERDERCYDERLQELFQEAVAVRLAASGPVLAELSGGFDSSSIVCMASRLIRSRSVAAPALATVSCVYPGSLDLPFIREIESCSGIDGVHLSTREVPLFSASRPVGALPQSGSPLQRAVAAIARARGATTLLTGQAGDLMMGNWIDDSLQIARFFRRGRVDLAWTEALAWSKVTRVPAPHLFMRAIAASLSLPSGCSRLFASVTGLTREDLAACSVRPELLRQTGLTNPSSMFSTEWRDAPVERRGHWLSLSVMRQLRTLQPFESLPGLDYTHPFTHRPLVEFLMRLPAEVLCRPGEPRRLMRRSLSDLWPPRLRARRSKGLFAAPYLDAFQPFAAALLRDRRWHVVERGWVERDSFTRRLDRLVRCLECRQPQLRQILLLENWMRHRFGARSTEIRLAS